MFGNISFRFFRFLQFLISLLAWPYSILCGFAIKKRKIPNITDHLLRKRASELAQMIRERKISATTVMQSYTERIKAVNPIINSVIQDRFKEALVEAYEVDKMIEGNPDPAYWANTKPLLGVPISIKEAVGVRGMSQNGGRLRPRERFAQDDGFVVKNLRNAGAIPTVVTNTPELSSFWESYNYAHGITKNPHDTRRTAGGSSGGEAALLSAGGSVIGVGSDLAGSGRIPALFCGVFGHKPSSRLIPPQGHLPSSSDPDWDKYLVIAPMARYASDLKLVLRCAAPQNTAYLRLEEPVDIKTIKVYYMEECITPLVPRIDPEVKATVQKAAMHFKKYGIQPQKIMIKEMAQSIEALDGLLLSMKTPQNVFQKSEDVDDWTLWTAIWELLRKFVGFGRVTMYSILFFIGFKHFKNFPKERVDEYKSYKERFIKYFEDLLGDSGVLILPVFPATAQKHYQMYTKLFEVLYVIMFNLLEMPATACPLGFSRNDMPLGVQIVANRLQDRLTLAVAEELEDAYGGWIPPSGLKEEQY